MRGMHGTVRNGYLVEVDVWLPEHFILSRPLNGRRAEEKERAFVVFAEVGNR